MCRFDASLDFPLSEFQVCQSTRAWESVESAAWGEEVLVKRGRTRGEEEIHIERLTDTWLFFAEQFFQESLYLRENIGFP